MVCSQSTRTVCNEVQGETAEKSKSRAPATPPLGPSSGLHIDRFLWGVVPQSFTRLSPHRNSTRELVGLGGRDRSQVRGEKKRERESAQPERVTGSKRSRWHTCRMPVTAARFDEPVYWNWGMMQTHVRPETPAQDALPSPLRRPEDLSKGGPSLDASMKSPRRSFARAGFRKTIPFLDARAHLLRHARHAQRCLAGVMIHLRGSRSTRRPIVSFHFIPTGVRVLHLGGGRGGAEGSFLFGCQSHDLTCLGDGRPGRPRWVRVAQWRVLLWASFISRGEFSNTTARTNLCRCGTSVTLARSNVVVAGPQT